MAIAIAVIITTSAIGPVSVRPVVAQPEQPLFSMVLIAPGANAVRREWAQVIADSMASVGIDAKVVYLGFPEAVDRVLGAPEDKWNKTFDQGGYDGLFVAYPQNPILNPKIYFYGDKSFYPPGWNFFHWNNSIANGLMDKFLSKPGGDWDAYHDFWVLENDELPAITVVNAKSVLVYNPAIEGLHGVSLPPGFPSFETTKVPPGKNTITYAVNVDMLQSAAPWATSSGYDWYWEYEVFEYLVQPNLDFSGYHPQLATSWETSADGLTWTVHLRNNVKFHDGVEMTADDVVWTYYLNTDPEAASVAYGYLLGVLGHQLTFTWLNGTSTAVDRGAPHDAGAVKALDKYTVQFTLPRAYGLFYPETMCYNGVPIIPKHVLEPIGMANLRTHPFSTGQGSYTVNLPGGGTYEATGPIGTKAYKWESWDPSKKMITLKKFNDYWDRQRLESLGEFAVDTLAYVTITEKEPAIAALKSGQVDVLTHEYQVDKEYASGVFDNAWSKAELFDPAEWQELGLNMYHPIFGTGVDTPLGKSDPSKAAEAAKDVRKAISYLVPRSLIVDKLLDGLGSEGIVPMAPWSQGYPKELQPYPYSIEKAREELEAAGYQVPGGPLTLSAPSTTLAGQSLTIEGTFMNLTSIPPSPYGNLTISVYQSMDKNTWTLLGNVTTGSDGKYAYTTTLAQPGTYYFKSLFAGKTVPTEQYSAENPAGRAVIAPQNSDIATVAAITFWDAYGTTIAAVVVVLILVLVGVTVLLRKRRKPA